MSETGLMQIFANILPETKASLDKMCEVSGLSLGEIIDRMALKWHAKDPEHAAQLILDDTIIHTRDLTPEDFNLTVAIVLAVIKESLSMDEPQAIKKLLGDIETKLNKE